MGRKQQMRRRGRLACGLVILIGTTACDRRDAGSTAQPPPTQPLVRVTAPRPVGRPPAVLQIDGQPAKFPAAKLVLSRNAGSLDAVLCSDDPPTAIDPGYLGNSFMFEMRLDVDDPADLPSAVWEWKAPRKGVQDSSDGIFLVGGRHELQPADVRVTFTRPDPAGPVVATFSGAFYAFEPHDLSTPVRTVTVAGSIQAAVQEQ